MINVAPIKDQHHLLIQMYQSGEQYKKKKNPEFSTYLITVITRKHIDKTDIATFEY